MKKALIGCAAMLLMVFAVGSAEAANGGHGGGHGHGHSGHGHSGHGHGHSRGPTVVVRSAPSFSYRSYGWNPVYTQPYCIDSRYHHHHAPVAVPVNRSGFYLQFGF